MRGMTDPLGLPPAAWSKADLSPDADFYRPRRLVAHIDEAAIAALTELYRELLPEGGRVLDLMSSWISHLPPETAYAEVVGHGMNRAELQANPRLDRWWVQDLNGDPLLPLDSGTFDAALITVSVQYLQRPVEVMAELRRVLKPEGRAVISFSNRCFPTKAVAVWGALDERGRAGLVATCLKAGGFARVEARRLRDGRTSDPMTAVVGWTA